MTIVFCTDLVDGVNQSLSKKNYGLESGADQTDYVFVRDFDLVPKLCLHSMKRMSHRSAYFRCFAVDMSYDQMNLLFIDEENTAMPGENCKLPEFRMSRK